MDLSERIIRARKAAGLSQEELGQRLGVTRQAVSKWETGQTKPDADMLVLLCRELGLSADYLLLGVEETAQAPAPAQEEETYAILLNAPVEDPSPAPLKFLRSQLGYSEEEVRAMLGNAPGILLWDLDFATAQEAMDLLGHTCGYQITPIRNSNTSSLDKALKAQPVAALQKKPKEPMGFGMTVAAVALGVVAAMLLLSLF